MRVLVVVTAALATLGLAAFGIFAAQNAASAGRHDPRGAACARFSDRRCSDTPQPPNPQLRAKSLNPSLDCLSLPRQRRYRAGTVPVGPLQRRRPPRQQPNRLAWRRAHRPIRAPAWPARARPAPTPHRYPACNKAGGMGIERVVEIDTTGGPAFGMEHFKQYDFLREHEVVLTFDDGPWPENTAAVIKALTDQCAKGTSLRSANTPCGIPNSARSWPQPA